MAYLEWLRLLATLGGGIALLAAGRQLAGRSASARNIGAASAAGAAVLAGIAHYPPIRLVTGPLLCSIGGEAIVACWALLALLGFGWLFISRPLGFLALTLALLALLVVSGAPLWWRYSGGRARSNYPDAHGLLQQTSITCAPASASMMLARHGFRVSEADLAERAGTNPLTGTDEYALARAIEAACRGRLRGRAGRLNENSARKLGAPFVAYIRRPDIGGHAVLVVSMTDSEVRVCDPLYGSEENVPASEFLSQWSGVAVWLEPPG